MIIGTFAETPGLRATLPDAGRLLGLEETVCRAVLDDLVDEGVLRRSADQKYALLE